jgi:hypothetical protein
MCILREGDLFWERVDSVRDKRSQVFSSGEHLTPFIIDMRRGVIESLKHGFTGYIGPRLMRVPCEQYSVSAQKLSVMRFEAFCVKRAQLAMSQIR